VSFLDDLAHILEMGAALEAPEVPALQALQARLAAQFNAAWAHGSYYGSSPTDGAQTAQAAALARCRADGFTCEVRANTVAVVGWAAGAGSGSDCSPGNQWRFYCYGNGGGATCGLSNGLTPCLLGEIHSGHTVQCGCNNNAPVIGAWCN
jgi:hypothetical protein